MNEKDTKVEMALDRQSSSSNSGSSGEGTGEREGWGGKLDFILTCIGYAVGLGNVWRFPYLCYRSGGGAFFVPYLTFLVLCGIPLFFMEVCIGQFSSLSPVAIWSMCPIFKGVGVGMVIVSGICCIYYNVIIAWTLYYLFMSFRSVLPWSHCGNPWNTWNCVDEVRSENSTNETFAEFYARKTNYNISLGLENLTLPAINGTVKYITASEQFWERHVLELTDGINNVGSIRWQLLIALVLSWIFVFLCLFKGVAVLGKVMHFAAPFPYLVLLVLLVRGVTLPGALEGIKFYIIPDFDKLATFKVWGDAALQIFYSVGMGWGGIITMASYNKFNANAHRDGVLVPIINCGTSIFAGFVIFSVLGFMAHEANVSVDKVVNEGPGLTFVAYPEAIAKMPISPLWAFLFFFMLFIIGLDSQFGMFECLLSGFIDQYPSALRNKKALLCAVSCIAELLLGLPLVTQGGMYVLQVMDWYCASFSLMLISLAEVLVVTYIYGLDRFMKDIELMIGRKPNVYFRITWRFLTPATIIFIWLFSVITLGPVTYGDYTYPDWSIVVGWMIGLCSVVPIPIFAIIAVYKQEGPILERVKKLCRPTKEWGPALPANRKLYLASLGNSFPETEEWECRHPDCQDGKNCKVPEHASLVNERETTA